MPPTPKHGPLLRGADGHRHRADVRLCAPRCVGNRMIGGRPADASAWHSDRLASGGPQNVYAPARRRGSTATARGTASMRATFSAAGSRPALVYFVTISRVGRDIRIGMTRATQGSSISARRLTRGQGAAAPAPPAQVGRRDGASRRSVPAHAAAAARPRARAGANDHIVDIAPPSAWTRSQIFASGRMTAAQDGRRRAAQHKEKVEAGRLPEDEHARARHGSHQAVQQPGPASNYFRKSHTDSGVIWDRPGLRPDISSKTSARLAEPPRPRAAGHRRTGR